MPNSPMPMTPRSRSVSPNQARSVRASLDRGAPAWAPPPWRSTGGTKPIGPRRRRRLSQSTHSSVAYSTASMLRQGPRRRMTSVLNSPMMAPRARCRTSRRRCRRSARFLPLPAVPCTKWTGIAIPCRYGGEVVGRSPRVQRLLEGIEGQVASARSYETRSTSAAGHGTVGSGSPSQALSSGARCVAATTSSLFWSCPSSRSSRANSGTRRLRVVHI